MCLCPAFWTTVSLLNSKHAFVLLHWIAGGGPLTKRVHKSQRDKNSSVATFPPKIVWERSIPGFFPAVAWTRVFSLGVDFQRLKCKYATYAMRVLAKPWAIFHFHSSNYPQYISIGQPLNIETMAKSAWIKYGAHKSGICHHCRVVWPRAKICESLFSTSKFPLCAPCLAITHRTFEIGIWKSVLSSYKESERKAKLQA